VGEESKSIGAETTFAEDIGDDGELRRRLDGLATGVAKRLRKEGFRTHTVHIKARYPDFTTVTRAVTLPASTAATQVIIGAARRLLENRLEREGRPLRLLGVSVSNLVRPAEGEPELFPDRTREQEERVDHLLDDLQARFGSKTIWRGEPKRRNRDDL
jgi:nucleotidyltransferase/DNA polymerase involved in DNA repair